MIPVGWQPIVAIGCQLAWLCSFQGPRKALRPVWAIGLSKLNSMRPPVPLPAAVGRGAVPAGHVRWPYGRQVRSMYLEPAELGRRGMRRRQVPALQSWSFPRKEVIQPHLPVRLPCYDFVPVAAPALGRCLLAVGPRTSRLDNSHDVTGGVYKARVRIHRAMADTRLLATPPSWGRVAAPNLHWVRPWRFASGCPVAARCDGHCSVCVAPGVRAMRT